MIVHNGFLFSDPAPIMIYTLSLHDALPIFAPPPGRALDVVLARVLSPDEVAPRADGALVLVDSETGERLRIDGREAAARYEAAAAEHAGALAAFAARHRIRLAGATSDQSFEEAALELLSRSRLLQRT
mgnify:CR=1 FL=1